MTKIPDPLPVQVKSTSDDNERYGDEKSNRDANLRAAHGLNRITIWGAVIATLSLVVLYFSILQSRETFQAGQRAWVLIDSVKIIPDIPSIADGKESHFPIFIKNSGLSPALNVVMKDTALEATGACKPDVILRLPVPDSRIILAPQQSGTNPNIQTNIGQGCIDALQNGTASIKVVGKITMTIFSGKLM